MHDAEDDVLFRVVEMQSGIADHARKKGRLRPASASLDKAFKEGAMRAAAGQPAGLLACASVRLQSCATLSRFHKHGEALEEACAAVLEMDKLWKEFGTAHGVSQAAERDNRCVEDALKKVYPGLRALMSKPPKWLEKAVIVSVEAKHCVALELEYCILEKESTDAAFSDLQQAIASGDMNMHSHRPSAQKRPQSAPSAPARKITNVTADDDMAWALSVASAGGRQLADPWGLIERLHTEGLALAELLLQPGHPVLERSKRTELQARGRNPALAERLALEAQEAAERAAQEASRRAAEEAERNAAREAARRAAEEEAARRAAEEAARVAAMWQPNRELGEERAEQIVVQWEKVGFKDHEDQHEQQDIPDDRSEGSEERHSQRLLQVESWRRNDGSGRDLCSTSGDMPLSRVKRPASAFPQSLSAANLVNLLPVAQGAPSVQRRPSSSPAVRSSSTPVARGERTQDIFKEWKSGQSSYNQLSYLQKKLATESGVDDMKRYFKREQTRLGGFLKDLSPDVLYENRISFAPSMVAKRKKQQERFGLGQEPASKPTSLAATNNLEKEMIRTWSSLYGGFRDDDGLANRKLAKEFNRWLKSEGIKLSNDRPDRPKRDGTTA
jgi:hypothetical protein